MDNYAEYAKQLRSELHSIPERSMQETLTKNRLIEYISENTDLEIYDFGQWFTAEYITDATKEALCFRTDFDAVTGPDGKSRHLCGHDGHASILAAFARWVSDNKPERNIIILFQPGEESGEGAKVCKAIFKRRNISEIYGLHNIPGFDAGNVLLRKGTFACASTGLEIKMCGKTTHAAYPENGINPGIAIAKLVLRIDEYAKLLDSSKGMILSTVIGIDVGSQSYGVAASDGTLRLTVRAEKNDTFNEFLEYINGITSDISNEYGISFEIKEIERFPSTENHDETVDILERAGRYAGLKIEFLDKPFRWSEDFGWYLSDNNGAMFGIGAGKNCPGLHTESYEFPDDIICSALKVYRAIAVDC